ncbi:MAG: hypothetical protein HYR60_33640 [Acidobacteria bacterium]|nr:hypothetical protein [Acidobacteriota bacterium]
MTPDQACEQLGQQLARTKAELEQFAYVVSHDLQEPVRLIAGFVQLLERRYKGKLDATADEFIASAMEGVAQMQERIQGLLEYSRISTRGGEFQPVDCERLFQDVLASLRAGQEESAAVVTHDPLPTLSADARQLRVVFQQLLSNAVRYRSEDPPRVHLRAQADGAEWTFSIQDNGIGLDPQYAAQIFVIFRRLHTRSEYPGTGLGLALCKRIVERHGGRIWVESEPGKGAAFHFTLPERPARTAC